jgi:hypothetical protein
MVLNNMGVLGRRLRRINLYVPRDERVSPDDCTSARHRVVADDAIANDPWPSVDLVDDNASLPFTEAPRIAGGRMLLPEHVLDEHIRAAKRRHASLRLFWSGSSSLPSDS